MDLAFVRTARVGTFLLNECGVCVSGVGCTRLNICLPVLLLPPFSSVCFHFLPSFQLFLGSFLVNNGPLSELNRTFLPAVQTDLQIFGWIQATSMCAQKRYVVYMEATALATSSSESIKPLAKLVRSSPYGLLAILDLLPSESSHTTNGQRVVYECLCRMKKNRGICALCLRLKCRCTDQETLTRRCSKVQRPLCLLPHLWAHLQIICRISATCMPWTKGYVLFMAAAWNVKWVYEHHRASLSTVHKHCYITCCHPLLFVAVGGGWVIFFCCKIWLIAFCLYAPLRGPRFAALSWLPIVCLHCWGRARKEGGIWVL